MTEIREKIGYISLGILSITAIITVILLGPMEQSEEYHIFCDAEMLIGINNFWNVVSNLPFLIVGILGIVQMKNIEKYNLEYKIFFIGVSLIAIGSGYYHLDPNNKTLVWDRLPITVAFMSLFSIVISEFINYKYGKKLFLPALLIGTLSVVYWVFFDDLRIYGLVQFYPIISIPIIITFINPK